MLSPDTPERVDGLSRDSSIKTKPQKSERGGFFGRNRFRLPGKWLNLMGAVILTVSSIPIISMLLEGSNASARESHFTDQNPKKPLEVKGGVSPQLQPAQIIDWTDSLGRSRTWGEIDNFRFGTGPNNPDRRMGTVPDKANGVYLWSFQGRDALYAETTWGNGVSVLINGMAVFGSRAVLATAIMVSTDGSVYRGCAEFIPDSNNPLDYNSRFAFCEGFPVGGSENYGSVFTSFTSGVDSNGQFIDAGINKDDGIYRHRFDTQGKPVGTWVRIKHAYYSYFPLILKGFPGQ